MFYYIFCKFDVEMLFDYFLYIIVYDDGGDISL